MILLGAFFLHPLPVFCWPELGLTSSDHLYSLFASEPESMPLAVCLFVLPGSKMCPFVSASASWLVIQERLLSAMPTERKQQCFLLRWLLCLESKETRWSHGVLFNTVSRDYDPRLVKSSMNLKSTFWERLLNTMDTEKRNNKVASSCSCGESIPSFPR